MIALVIHVFRWPMLRPVAIRVGKILNFAITHIVRKDAAVTTDDVTHALVHVNSHIHAGAFPFLTRNTSRSSLGPLKTPKDDILQ